MFEYFITNYGTQLLNAVLCALFGVIGWGLKQLAARYINDDTKRAVAKTAAAYVEQVYKDIHGPDKLNAALTTASDILMKKGVSFTVEEMEVLIEAAVGEFNDAFKKSGAAESQKE